MNQLKDFEEYVQKGIVRKVKIDINRAKSLFEGSDRKLNSLKERLEKIEVTNINSNDYAESCYDILMILVRAKMLTLGLSASGFKAHEAEVTYLKNFGLNENEIIFMDKLRYFRNGMLYYGTILDKDYADKVIEFFNKFYPKMRKLVLDALTDKKEK